MCLVIDVGNTRVKEAVFQGSVLVEVFLVEKEKFFSKTEKIIKKYSISRAIISSVGKIAASEIKKIATIIPVLELTSKTEVPFINLYGTPNTLGVDRIALMAAAVKTYPNKNVLVIDAGTCITFDFVNKKSEYLGGAITPGIRLRYKVLNDYTANLPLLETTKPQNFVGNNTESSIHSGVINGIVNEIDGVINQYQKKYQDLTVVLTGGDMKFLAEQLKNSIFANPNFILEGLHTILIYNKEE